MGLVDDMKVLDDIRDILTNIGMTVEDEFTSISYRDVLFWIVKDLKPGKKISDYYDIKNKSDLDALVENVYEEICENIDTKYAFESFLDSCWEA